LPLDDSAMHESLTVYDTKSNKPFFFDNKYRPSTTKKKKSLTRFLISDAQAAPSSKSSGQARLNRWSNTTHKENTNNSLTLFSPDTYFVYTNNSIAQTTPDSNYVRLKSFGKIALSLSKEIAAIAFSQTRMQAAVSGVGTGINLDDLTTAVYGLITGREEKTNFDSLINELGFDVDGATTLRASLLTFYDLLSRHGEEADGLSFRTHAAAATVDGAMATTTLQKHDWHIKIRLEGAFQAALATVEGVTGVAETMGSLPTVVGPIAGGLLVADSLDRAGAAIYKVIFGKERKTGYIVITGQMGLDPDLAELGKDVFLSLPSAYIALNHIVSEAYLSKFSIETIGFWRKKPTTTSYLADVEQLTFGDKVHLDQQSYNQLLHSVEKYGFPEPVKLFKASTGETYVLEGNEHLSAALDTGFKKIPAHEVQLPYRNITSEEQITQVEEGYTKIMNRFA